MDYTPALQETRCMACCSADEQLLAGDVLISAEKSVDASLLKYSNLLDGS